MTQVELALDARAILGEGPRWCETEERLYWVDIGRNALHRFDPASGSDEARVFAEPVGCFAFLQGGGLLLAMTSGLYLLKSWDNEPRLFARSPFAGDAERRYNDGRTDPAGRFWVGSVNTAKSSANAALYRVSGDGVMHEIEGGMMTANGAAFSGDGARFFHADTPSHAIRAYTCDAAGGILSGRRIFHQFPLGQGRPDGGSVDEEGCYWSALFDGGRVVRLSPDGEIVQSVALPITRPTMIAFGGADRKTAYVTSARTGLNEAMLAKEPLAGGIFSFRVEVPGLPEFPFRLF